MMKMILKIGIGQINPCVGDFKYNTDKICAFIRRAKDKKCDIVVFPELAVSGYPPEDLIYKKGFVDKNKEALNIIKNASSGIAVIVGFIRTEKNKIFNSAAFLYNKKIIGIYDKIQLPNYGVFDEKRYFASGEDSKVYNFKGIKIGMDICEDIWVKDGPILRQAKKGAKIIFAINASPYHLGKIDLRREILKSQAKKHKVSIVYANIVGGQDELVFDGRSIFIDAKGKVVFEAKAFEEELAIVEPARPKKPSMPEEVYRALVLGLRDYVLKNGFKKAVLGLSGGVDSSLVTCLAVDALGKDNVIGVFMPSQFSSQESREDAQILAKNLGIKLEIISIQEIFELYLAHLKEQFKDSAPNIAEENLQARIRGNILMALSNKFGWLVLTTGNKSEVSVGYATLYGDMAGGFAAIKDVPKALVYQLSRYKNAQAARQIIPERVLTKAPTAELRENQKDSDSLPEYDTLDPILKAYIEENKSCSQIVRGGFDKDTVKRVIAMVDSAEYKRRQSPPGIKITPRAFGRDRRMPITNRYREE